MKRVSTYRVTGDHLAGQPAVANMSLSGGANAALDTAVRNMITDGVSAGVAAGNGNILGIPVNSCNQSPARVAEAAGYLAAQRRTTICCLRISDSLQKLTIRRRFSAAAACLLLRVSLCLCGYYALEITYHRDSETRRIAQRRTENFVEETRFCDLVTQKQREIQTHKPQARSSSGARATLSSLRQVL
jgi:hypothetical protein